MPTVYGSSNHAKTDIMRRLIAESQKGKNGSINSIPDYSIEDIFDKSDPQDTVARKKLMPITIEDY